MTQPKQVYLVLQVESGAHRRMAMWAINRGEQHFFRVRYLVPIDSVVCVHRTPSCLVAYILGLLGVITVLFTYDIY